MENMENIDKLNIIKNFNDKYKEHNKTMNLELKKKYFNNFSSFDRITSLDKITSLDDTFDILYLKLKYINKNINNKIQTNLLSSLNYDEELSGNILTDINNYLKRFNTLSNILHDDKWIESNYLDNQNNYFDAEENQILLYNSTDKISLNSKDFKEFVFNLNLKLLEFNKIYKVESKVDIYEDNKYDILWIIINIRQQIF